MTSLQQREAMIEALTFHALSEGKGDVRQQGAYQELEWRRCAADVEYFLDRYGYIIDGGRVAKWEMWPIQRLVLRTLQTLREKAAKKRISGGIIGIKARQLGITTTTAHYDFWDVLFHDASKWDVFSHSEEKAKDILDRVQATKDRLPRWMIQRAQNRNSITVETQKGEREKVKRGDKSDSITRISFGFSQMKIASSTPRNIQGATSNINLDEFTLHTEQQRKLQQMLATIDGASGIGIVIANGNGEDEFFHFYQQAKKGENGFVPFFFWWGDAPHRLEGAIVTIDGVEHPHTDFTRDELMRHAAMGRLKAPWYDRMQRSFLMKHPEADDFAFRAVYPTTEQEAFYISANSRFKLATVNGILETLRSQDAPETGSVEPEGTGFHLEPRAKGPWRVYERPVKGERYVIGMDSSGGSQAGDYAVCQVGKLLGDGYVEQVAVLQSKIEPTELAYEGIKAGKWYNEAYLVPEANNTGQVLVDYLKADYFNLYMRRQKVDKFSTGMTPNIGFWTDTSSKPRLIGNLAAWLYADKLVLHDSPTVQEMAHYEIKEDGIRTGAPKGMNDDCVMALALMVEGAIDLATFHAATEPRILMPWED